MCVVFPRCFLASVLLYYQLLVIEFYLMVRFHEVGCVCVFGWSSNLGSDTQ